MKIVCLDRCPALFMALVWYADVLRHDLIMSITSQSIDATHYLLSKKMRKISQSTLLSSCWRHRPLLTVLREKQGINMIVVWLQICELLTLKSTCRVGSADPVEPQGPADQLVTCWKTDSDRQLQSD